jgi:hypothetical protein
MPRRKRRGADRRGCTHRGASVVDGVEACVMQRERSLAERTAAMEARPRKRTARERMAYVRGKMRSRGERATATEVASTEVAAADVEAATTKAAAATVEAAATTMEATAAVKATAAATMATTASSICGDRQDDRASQYGSARDEFRPEFQHGHRHDSLPRNQVAPSASNRCPSSIQQETNCSNSSIALFPRERWSSQ